MGLTRIICGFGVIVGALLNIAYIAHINVAGQCVLIFVGCLIAMWGVDDLKYQKFLEKYDSDHK